MEEFVKSGGQTLNVGEQLHNKQKPTLVKRGTLKAIKKQESIANMPTEDEIATMTPKQRAALRKQQEADKRAAELHNAARGAKQNYDAAKQMKL